MMCLLTLHDKIRRLGLGAMYEKHWASGFRDLLDSQSPEWEQSPLAQKMIDLAAFESAGVGLGEIVENYRETWGRAPNGPNVLNSLSEALQRYRAAGFPVPMPESNAGVSAPAEAVPHGIPGKYAVWVESAQGDPTLASDTFANEEDACDGANRMVQQAGIRRARVYDEFGSERYAAHRADP
ncbi:MAG TPA: hypothetical protein VLJ39_15575 [Tepidisphaeraceae bacterium]|nr:hypothetical protein [Tepidisphaeraceae bacterium]